MDLDRPPFFFGFPQDSSGRHHFRWYGHDNRYTDYWVGILHGDLGSSFRTDRPVIDLILERYPATIELAIAAMLIAVAIAIPLGVIAGKNRGTWIDNVLIRHCPGGHQSAELCHWSDAGLPVCSEARLAVSFGTLRLERHHPAGIHAGRRAFRNPDSHGALVSD